MSEFQKFFHGLIIFDTYNGNSEIETYDGFFRIWSVQVLEPHKQKLESLGFYVVNDLGAEVVWGYNFAKSFK